ERGHETQVSSLDVTRDEALFEKTPLLIVSKFLAHVAGDVPSHVFEAMARRFIKVMDGESRTLDHAFGGRIRWQRNHLDKVDRQLRLISGRGLEELLVFSWEIPEDEALFERMPLCIASRFLQCF